MTEDTTSSGNGEKGAPLVCPNCGTPYAGEPPQPGDLVFCASCSSSIPTQPPPSGGETAPAAPAKRKGSTTSLKKPPGEGESTTFVCPTCHARVELTGYKTGEIRFCDKCNSSLAEEKKTALGKVLGRYRVEEEIGRGAMAVVYRATQEGLKRPVALKVLLAPEGATEDQVARLHAEAQAAAKLRHPNIVTVLDVDTVQNLHYIAMDFVDGKPLSAVVGKRRFQGKAAAAIVAKAAQAIHYAHDQGIIHRDLKPSNIFLGKGDEPMVMDFGLARDVASGKKGGKSGAAVSGTPEYMSPEQARGVQESDRRSDVYSLGAVLYALLTGQPPHKGETPQKTLEAVLHETPKSPRELNPSVAPDLEGICLKAMAKVREARYASARALAEDLERFVRDEVVSVVPSSAVRRLTANVRKHPAAAAAGGVAILVALLVLAYVLVPRKAPGSDRHREEALAAQREKEEREREEESRKQWERRFRESRLAAYEKIRDTKSVVRSKVEAADAQAAANPDQALQALDEAEMLLREMPDRITAMIPEEFRDQVLQEKKIQAELVTTAEDAAIQKARSNARGARAWQSWAQTLDLEKACEEYHLALQAAPHSAYLLLCRGMVYREAAMWKEAWEDLDAVARKEPGRLADVEMLKYALDASIRGGFPVEAENLVGRLPADSLDLRYYQGLLDLARGDLDAAASAFAEIKKKSFQHGPAWVGQAEVLVRRGKFKEAADGLTLVIEFSRKFLSTLQRRKTLREDMLARRDFLDALVLRGQVRAELLQAVQGEERIALAQQARADFEEALKINPADARARAGVKALEG